MWTWWEIIVVALLASIAFNTLFTGTDDNVVIKAGTYVLLFKGVFAGAIAFCATRATSAPASTVRTVFV
jgi:hypothetical protein